MKAPPGLRFKYVTRGDCWPLYGRECRVDPNALENIDPNYGGPTRDEVLNRGCPMCGNRLVF